MFCSKCGTQNPDDANFCFKCGIKLIVNVTEIKQTENRIEEMSGYRNEMEDIIPQSVYNAIKGSGLSESYVYKEGNIRDPPSSNVPRGKGRNHRFGSLKSALPHKIAIGSTGWVYFKSPSQPPSHGFQLPSHGGMINRNKSNSMQAMAEKHTYILCKTEDIFKNIFPNFKTYLTVHRIGDQVEFYKEAEKKTNRTFYHLTMPNQHPDAIIVEKDFICYVVEVKWGYLEQFPNEKSDFDPYKFSPDQYVQNLRDCRVIGPYVQNGIELNGSEKYDFKVNQNTKFLVVSDLKGLRDLSHIKKINAENQRFNICDIKNNTDAYKSLETYLRTFEIARTSFN